MTGQEMYEKEAKNWPSPIGWENLEPESQYLWIQRARKIAPPINTHGEFL